MSNLHIDIPVSQTTDDIRECESPSVASEGDDEEDTYSGDSHGCSGGCVDDGAGTCIRPRDLKQHKRRFLPTQHIVPQPTYVDQECSICLEKCQDDPWSPEMCNDSFHKECLVKALSYKRKCPTCQVIVGSTTRYNRNNYWVSMFNALGLSECFTKCSALALEFYNEIKKCKINLPTQSQLPIVHPRW